MCIVNTGNMPLLRRIITYKTTNEIDGCKKLLHICCIWFLGVGLDHPWNIFALETVEGVLWKGRCVMEWQVRSCCVRAVGYGKGTEDGNLGMENISDKR